MKKLGFALLMFAALASPAMADQIQVHQGLYQSGSGGEFAFQTLNPIGWLDTSAYAATTKNQGYANSFQTFCLEVGETISFGGIYNANLNSEAVNGGTDAGPHPDPVSEGTGYLYSEFAKGTLTGYNFGGTAAQRQASAASLQNAIWWLEDAPWGVVDAAYQTILFNKFGANWAVDAKLGTSLTYHVYAVNMWTLNGGLAQDGLFYDVPEGGATLMLLGGVLMGLGALRRKIRG